MIEYQRTRIRTGRNYVVQSEHDDEVSGGTKTIGSAHDTDPLIPNSIPEESPTEIVDYVKTIKNDILLFDNSLQTRTRNRTFSVRSIYDDVSKIFFDFIAMIKH